MNIQDSHPSKKHESAPAILLPSNEPPKMKLDHINPTSPQNTHKHRYPTRLKTAKAAQVMQLEEAQVLSNDPVTLQIPLDGINPPQQLSYKQLLQTDDRQIWKLVLCNELGRLAQGYGDVKGRNTFYFIPKYNVPKDKWVTYARLVCAIRPQKKETYRVRLTAGGNLITYPGNTSTLTAGIVTIKTHWNSVISTPNCKYCTIDIKDFYLNSKLESYEYMCIPYDILPQDIIDLYNLSSLVADDGFVYIEVHGGIYGLPQAGRLAHDDLVTHLAPYNYKPATHTPGLWINATNNITFTLVVDDFGVKYSSDFNLKHLIEALETKYTITIDLTGNLYIGVTLKWNYRVGEFNCSMPGYYPSILKRLNHQLPNVPQYSPHPAPHVTYGKAIQYASNDTSPLLDGKGIKLVQSVLGVFYMVQD